MSASPVFYPKLMCHTTANVLDGDEWVCPEVTYFHTGSGKIRCAKTSPFARKLTQMVKSIKANKAKLLYSISDPDSYPMIEPYCEDLYSFHSHTSFTGDNIEVKVSFGDGVKILKDGVLVPNQNIDAMEPMTEVKYRSHLELLYSPMATRCAIKVIIDEIHIIRVHSPLNLFADSDDE